jgi:hypothetical protein
MRADLLGVGRIKYCVTYARKSSEKNKYSSLAHKWTKANVAPFFALFQFQRKRKSYNFYLL